MNSLAQQALDRAREEPFPVLCSKVQLASVLDDIDPPLDINAIDTSGPINRVRFFGGAELLPRHADEGRRGVRSGRHRQSGAEQGSKLCQRDQVCYRVAATVRAYWQSTHNSAAMITSDIA